MHARTILTVLAACVVLSTGIGFAFGAASQPDSATAAKRGKILKQIKRDIQALGNEVDLVQSGIGTTGIRDSLNDRIVRIETDTRAIESDTGRIESDTKTICRALDTLC